MVWLFVIGLGVWCAAQQSQLNGLMKRLEALASERLRPPTAVTLDPPSQAPAHATPSATTDTAFEPPRPYVPEPSFEVLGEAAEAAPAPQSPPDAPPRQTASDWLSQNGLAWIGGGALALGGLLLVAYAAERGLFNPAFRVGAAVVLGLLALAAGEALRRGLPGMRIPNLLVAALTTAAGAGILYAAIWAAYRLYGFIPAGAAIPLLSTVSLGLLGLALLHGEALGVLALAAAYAVPVVSGAGDWSGLPLDGFALLVLVTGLATAGLRRWTTAGFVALAGAGLWTLGRGFESDALGVALLAGLAAPLTLASSYLAKRVSPGPDRFNGLLPAAIVGASLLTLFLWSNDAPRAAAYAALATGAIAVAVAVGVRVALTTPRLLLAPALALAVVAAIWSRSSPSQPELIGLIVSAVWLLAAGFDGALRGDQRREAAVIGAAGAVIVLTLSIGSLARALPGWDWGIDAAFAAVIGGGAILLRRRADAPEGDLASAAWVAAAAEATGLALHASLDNRLGPTAYGLLAVTLTLLSLRVRWRGFAESAVAACLASFAALLTPAIALAAFGGAAGPLMIIAIGAGAMAAQLVAWRILKARGDVIACTEAASTLVVMTALLTLFLVLQTLNGAAGAPVALDEFTRASIRTLLFLAAGLMLSIRGAATPLGRARAPIFLGVGALHGVVLQVVAYSPWWAWGQPVVGPPVFDTLLLGLLAPALILVEASRRTSRQSREIATGAFGFALLFFAIWIVTELRRLFHGPTLTGDLGYAEAAAYAVAALGLALGLMTAGGGLKTLVGERQWLAPSLSGIAWVGLAYAAWIFIEVASPWWGPLESDLRNPLLLGVLYIAGCGLSAGLALMASRTGQTRLSQTALVAAGVELFVLLTLTTRYLYHGGAMRAPLHEASLETWTFSAVWALYGLAVLAAGAARKDPTVRWLGLAVLLAATLKVFLFDMARLEGVIRAASFLALGLVLLAGALAARRLGGAAARTNAS